MSIRRLVQLIVFISALAIGFAGPISSSTAYACNPEGGGAFCYAWWPDGHPADRDARARWARWTPTGSDPVSVRQYPAKTTLTRDFCARNVTAPGGGTA